VELPPNVLTAYPTVATTGYTFIELERKNEKSIDQTETRKEKTNTIALHLIPTPTRLEECLPPKFQKDITDYFNREKNKIGNICSNNNEDDDNDIERINTLSIREYSKVIHLHQDIWNSKRQIVRHRLMAQLGLGVHESVATGDKQCIKDNGRVTTSRRIFARKTVVRRITASIAMEFLDEHHLWGATKAKHNYGLFVESSNDANEGELVAVATFSTRRKIVRLGKPHRSHELLRFCSRRDSNVVGGISKLIKAFIREKTPDDIVTVVDRDWGDGSGWYSLGFQSVATMEPIVMAIRPFNEENVPRRHLVGAGIKNINTTIGNSTRSLNNKDRIGLSTDILQELNVLDSIEDILGTLSNHGFFPVYDTGVERLMKTISYDRNGNEPETTKGHITDLWQNSQPTYAKEYYSPNLGISVLLNYASSTPSALPQLIASSTIDRLVE